MLAFVEDGRPDEVAASATENAADDLIHIAERLTLDFFNCISTCRQLPARQFQIARVLGNYWVDFAEPGDTPGNRLSAREGRRYLASLS